MALGVHDPGGPERDAGLDRLYRHAGEELPRAEIDDAIRAAARKAVGARPQALGTRARRWGVPISIAAVVVVSVSLVTLMREEGADRLEEGYGPGRVESKAKPAEAPVGGTELESRRAAKRADQAPRPVPQAPAAPAADAGAPSSADDALRARSSVAPAGVRPEPASRELREQAGYRDREASTPHPAPERQSVGKKSEGDKAGAGALAPPSTRMLRNAPAASAGEPLTAQSAAKSERSPLDLRVDALVNALDGAAPPLWLEKIKALRKEGRKEEADALLEELKRRYPDYPIPSDELTQDR